MPRTAKVLQLPPEVRAQLDAKLRTNGYSGVVALSEWLDGLRHSIGKSALHDYALALRRLDAERGDETARISLRGVGDDLGGEEVNMLLIELGRLRLREAQILAKLAEIAPSM